MKAFFPWVLFWKSFLTLSSVSTILLLGILFVVSQVPASDLFWVWIFSCSLFSLFSMWYAYKLSAPLGEIISKTMGMAYRRKYAHLSNSLSDDALISEEPGEYSQLERALNRIQRKIKKRKEDLAAERESTQALMSSLADAVVSIDLQGYLQFYNSRFAVLFGGLKQNQIMINEIFREPELLNLINEVKTVLQSKTQTLQIKNPLSSHLQYFMVSGSPIMNQRENSLSGVLLLFHDISDVKRAEQIRIEFVENASHELRTPLTSIKGYLEAVIDDFRAGNLQKAPEFLNIISSSVDRLSLLVHDMLHLAHLDAGATLKKEMLDPHEVSELVLERLSKIAQSKKIEVVIENSSGPFLADPSKLEQVLENLLSNAFKYVPENSKVIVSWILDNDVVVLKVQDNGPGIAEEHLPRLFERFYRVDKGRARDAGGTGLGLAIVKHIVQSHGGKVDVKSVLGKGSEFICSFPKI